VAFHQLKVNVKPSIMVTTPTVLPTTMVLVISITVKTPMVRITLRTTIVRTAMAKTTTVTPRPYISQLLNTTETTVMDKTLKRHDQTRMLPLFPLQSHLQTIRFVLQVLLLALREVLVAVVRHWIRLRPLA